MIVVTTDDHYDDRNRQDNISDYDDDGYDNDNYNDAKLVADNVNDGDYDDDIGDNDNDSDYDNDS